MGSKTRKDNDTKGSENDNEDQNFVSSKQRSLSLSLFLRKRKTHHSNTRGSHLTFEYDIQMSNERQGLMSFDCIPHLGTRTSLGARAHST